MRNPIPTTVRLPETPTVPMLEKSGISVIWSKWFATLGTWAKNSQEVKTVDLVSGSTTIGTLYLERISNIWIGNGYLNPGTYDSTTVDNVGVKPVTEIPISISAGTAVFKTDGTMVVTSTSTDRITISFAAIASTEG